MIKTEYIPIIGLPLANGWAQVISNESNKLTCAFAISGKNANNIGRSLEKKLSHSSLSSISSLHHLILDLLKQTRSLHAQLQLAASLIIDDESIAFATYHGSATLKRGEKIGKVISSHDEIKIVKGSYKKNDISILATRQAKQYLPEIKQRFLNGFDINSIVTLLIPNIHNSSDSSLCSIALNRQIEIETAKEEEIDNYNKVDNLKFEEKLEQPEVIHEKTLEEKHSSEYSEESKVQTKKFQINYEDFFSQFKEKIIPFSKKGLRKIVKTSVALISKFGSIFSILGNSVTKKNTYVKKRVNKKTIRIVIILIAFSTVISILIVRKKVGTENDLKKVQQELEPIQTAISNSLTVADESPVQARKDVLDSIQKIEDLKKGQKNKQVILYINEQLDKAKINYEDISGKVAQQELNIFYNLRDIESDLIATHAAINEKNIIILDSEKKEIFQINLDDKKYQKNKEKDIKQISDISTNNKQLLILGSGIHQFDLDSNDSKLLNVKEEGESDKKATLISTFGNYIYIFNPSKRNIYRFLLKNGELSKAVGWLSDKKDLNFESIVSMAIDGDIWLSSNSGKILRYTKGKPVAFEIKGLGNPFNGSIYIFTNEDSEKLYVLDAGNSRITILDKEGNFIKEIKSESLQTATAIFAHEKKKMIYAVSGSIIFQIPI